MLHNWMHQPQTIGRGNIFGSICLSVCMCVCVCLSVCALHAEPLYLQTLTAQPTKRKRTTNFTHGVLSLKKLDVTNWVPCWCNRFFLRYQKNSQTWRNSFELKQAFTKSLYKLCSKMFIIHHVDKSDNQFTQNKSIDNWPVANINLPMQWNKFSDF